jgi:hypothetical protein
VGGGARLKGSNPRWGGGGWWELGAGIGFSWACLGFGGPCDRFWALFNPGRILGSYLMGRRKAECSRPAGAPSSSTLSCSLQVAGGESVCRRIAGQIPFGRVGVRFVAPANGGLPCNGPPHFTNTCFKEQGYLLKVGMHAVLGCW